jgi:serine/threonine protein kinase
MGNQVGKLLGRYEIVAEVGRGAMGSVFKARDPKIDRIVAIKTVLLHQSVIHEQEEFRRRFFVEAQAAGRLLHPGIVAVFDVGEEPGTSNPYIVMEYIEGQTLREVLANNGKKLPLNDALRIAQELAEALDYAHAQGVVHRDIKPANILITKDGQAKISDFGIAQLDLTHMTLPGRVLGTPAYMSPEQLEGEQVDGRSDLFSLGAILYTALTGYRPFQGNSATTVCFKVANRDPLQATSLAPELPHELDAVIARALQKNPAERYQRGKEFAEGIRKLRERAPAGQGTTLWFSSSADGRTWLDGKGKREGVLSEAPAHAAQVKVVRTKNAPPLLQAVPRKSSNFGTMFSSWQVQAAIGIPLFVAAIVVSLFAWREIRAHDPLARNSVGTADRTRGTGSVQNLQNQASGAAAGDIIDSHTAVDQAHSQDRLAAAIAGDAILPTPAAPSASSLPSGITKGSSSGKPRKSHSPGSKVDADVASKSVAATAKNGANAGASSTAGKGSGKPSEVETQPVVKSVAAVADSNVQIQIENHFSDAILKIWIDENLAYAHPLHDGRKKRLLLLGGGSKETLTLPVSSGQHALRIEVRSAGEQFDETKTVTGEFLTGGERNLAISFDKHTKEMRVTLGNE